MEIMSLANASLASKIASSLDEAKEFCLAKAEKCVKTEETTASSLSKSTRNVKEESLDTKLGLNLSSQSSTCVKRMKSDDTVSSNSDTENKHIAYNTAQTTAISSSSSLAPSMPPFYGYPTSNTYGTYASTPDPLHSYYSPYNHQNINPYTAPQMTYASYHHHHLLQPLQNAGLGNAKNQGNLLN